MARQAAHSIIIIIAIMAHHPAAILVVEHTRSPDSVHPFRIVRLLFPGDTLKFGRDPSKTGKNHVVMPEPTLSRNHFEIYCVSVDDDEQKHRPLAFVRDRQSNNGTFVNGKLVGQGPLQSPGWLLQHNDIITAGSYVSTRFQEVPMEVVPVFSLQSHQRQGALDFKDQYIIHNRTIGDGARAVIYLATEVKTRKQVVCKVYDLARFSDSSARLNRIRREAFILSDLDHPNIISFKAAFQTQNTMYTFTELATGGDLFSLQAKCKTFQEIEIRWIVRQVLTAVAYIHNKGIAHRDIKPENILCAIAPDSSYRVLLSDFGDAAMVSRGRMKSPGVGTRLYLAPECHTPEIGHGLSVDIWAIGMLELRLFAGINNELDPPRLDAVDPEGEDACSEGGQEAINAYLRNTLDSLYWQDDDFSEELSTSGRRFLHECLTYDKEKRPTAAQMLKSSWLQEPKEDNAFFKGLETESVASWAPRGPIRLAIEYVGLENGENASIESAENAAESDEGSPDLGRLEREILGYQQEASPEVTGAGTSKEKTFESLSSSKLTEAMREAKMGSKRRLDPLHAGRPKKQRLNSI